MMTEEEIDAKEAIIDELYESGYKPYAKLAELCEINLTRDPDCVAYMIPGRATIVVNANLRIDQVSTIVRHELLHEFLTHQIRALRYLGIDPDDITPEEAAKYLSEQDWIDNLYSKNISPQDHELFNIAGDYEISNVGYTARDKNIVKHIDLNDGRFLPGLVTDLDHPGWEELSFEELLDKLKEEKEKMKQQLPDNQDESEGSGDQGNNQKGSDGADKGPDSPGGDSGQQSVSQSTSQGEGSGNETEVSDEYARGWNKAVADFRSGKLRL